jgi:hypothetical protein
MLMCLLGFAHRKPLVGSALVHFPGVPGHIDTTNTTAITTLLHATNVRKEVLSAVAARFIEVNRLASPHVTMRMNQ